MLVSAKGEYVVGGGVIPIYSGGVEVTFGISDDTHEGDIQQEARIRLRRKVSQRMCLDSRLVKVSEVTFKVEYLDNG